MNTQDKFFHIVISYVLIFLPFMAMIFACLMAKYDMVYSINKAVRAYHFIYNSYFYNSFGAYTGIFYCLFSIISTVIFYKKANEITLYLLYFANSFLLGIFGVLILILL